MPKKRKQQKRQVWCAIPFDSDSKHMRAAKLLFPKATIGMRCFTNEGKRRMCLFLSEELARALETLFPLYVERKKHSNVRPFSKRKVQRLLRLAKMAS